VVLFAVAGGVRRRARAAGRAPSTTAR
jgi:hypothetical protein